MDHRAVLPVYLGNIIYDFCWWYICLWSGPQFTVNMNFCRISANEKYDVRCIVIFGLIRSSFVTIFKLLSFFSKGQVETSFLVKEFFLLETLIDHGIRGSRFRSICLFDYSPPTSVWPVSFDKLYLHGICYICSNMTSLLQMTVGHDILASTILMIFLHRQFWKGDKASTQYTKINICRWIICNAGRWWP